MDEIQQRKFCKTENWIKPAHVASVTKYQGVLVFFLKKIFIVFILEREKAHTHMGRGGAEGEGERIPSRFHAQRGA